MVLATLHDVDETLLNAWKGSGVGTSIEAGLEVLYEAISEYDNLMETVTNVFKGERVGCALYE